MIEENLRRAMVIADGNALVFLQRPGSLVAMLMCAALLIFASFSRFRAYRDAQVD